MIKYEKFKQAFDDLQGGLEVFIDSTVKKEFIENQYLNYDNLHQDILLYPNGELYLTGFMSRNNFTRSSYNGDSMVLASIQYPIESSFKIDEYAIDMLTEKEKENLFVTVSDEEGLYEEDSEDSEKEKSKTYHYDNIYELVNSYEHQLKVEEKFKEIFREKYDEYYSDYLELEWDFYRDDLLNKIYNNIKSLDNF